MARNGDASAVGIQSFGAKRANNFEEGNSCATVEENVFISDGVKGVGAFHSLFGEVFRVDANSLAESAKFVALGSVPGRTHPGVAAESVIL